MSKQTYENIVTEKLRFRHFHESRTVPNGSVVKKLVATIATAIGPDGNVFVGICRVHPDDNARRDVGRNKALHRLRRAIAFNTESAIGDGDLEHRESRKFHADFRRGLVQTMPFEVFMEKFIRSDPFALAEAVQVDEEVEVVALAG